MSTVEQLEEIVQDLNKQIVELRSQVAGHTNDILNTQNGVWAAHTYIGEKFADDFVECYNLSYWYESKKQRDQEAARIRQLTHQLACLGYTVAKAEPKNEKV